MTTTNGYLRSTRRRKRSERDNRVPRTEREESRRRNREFLRDRDETNTDEFEDYGGAFDGFNVYSDADSGF